MLSSNVERTLQVVRVVDSNRGVAGSRFARICDLDLFLCAGQRCVSCRDLTECKKTHNQYETCGFRHHARGYHLYASVSTTRCLYSIVIIIFITYTVGTHTHSIHEHTHEKKRNSQSSIKFVICRHLGPYIIP